METYLSIVEKQRLVWYSGSVENRCKTNKQKAKFAAPKLLRKVKFVLFNDVTGTQEIDLIIG